MRILCTGLIVWLLLPLCVDGQLEVSGQFSTDTIEIGGEVELILSILKPSDVSIKAVERGYIDSIYSAYQTLQGQTSDTAALDPVMADYEVLSYGLWQEPAHPNYFATEDLRWNTSESGQGELLENRFSLRLWDPGENFTFIPPVLYEMQGEDQVYYKGGIVRIFVAPPPGLEELDQDSLDLAPIKPIIAEKRNISDFVGIAWGAGALALLALAYWIFSMITAEKKEDESVPVVQPDPPHIIALGALQKLKEQKLWQAGDIKGYQSQLTYIIRQYIENRFDIHALEATTDRILEEVEVTGLPKKLVDVLDRVLRVADLVKFAKAKPDINIHDQFMQEAVFFVQNTIEPAYDETTEIVPAESKETLPDQNGDS